MLKTIHVTTRPKGFELWIKSCQYKKKRLTQNLEESGSDSDSEYNYDEFQNNNKTVDVIRDEEDIKYKI